MRTSKSTYLAASAALVLAATLFLLPGTASSEELDGKTLFVETHNCNMCHSVPAAEIQAKVKSEKMQGPALGGKIDAEFADIAAYVRKAGQLKGEEHNKEFKGSDEELAAILDWLAGVGAEP